MQDSEQDIRDSHDELLCDCNTGRLDAFIAGRLPTLSRRKAGSLCDQGMVLVNGRPARRGNRLNIGDRVTFRVPIAALSVPVESRPCLGAECLPEVLYEDSVLLAVSKPRKMHSVTLHADDPVTLADIVAAYCPECRLASPDPREGGLVQRLDYFTSGVVLAAKDRQIWELLHNQLISGEVAKTYLALVEGLTKERFKVDLPLVSSNDGQQVRPARSLTEKGALQAETSFRRIHVVGGRRPASLVKAFGYGLRRHQIRVHLSACGHALVGDESYGAETTLGEYLGEEHAGFFLHAATLRLRHPEDGEELTIRAFSDLEPLIKLQERKERGER